MFSLVETLTPFAFNASAYMLASRTFSWKLAEPTTMESAGAALPPVSLFVGSPLLHADTASASTAAAAPRANFERDICLLPYGFGWYGSGWYGLGWYGFGGNTRRLPVHTRATSASTISADNAS